MSMHNDVSNNRGSPTCLVNDEEEKGRPASQDSNDETEDTVPLKRSTLRSVCLVIACTMAMVVSASNSTFVSISMPTIGRDLGIEEDKLQWLMSAYSLSSGCLVLFFGRLADLHGRKKTFIVGSLSQMVFSLGCSFAKDGLALDILRGFQGAGAAATIPSALGILAHAFPPSKARSIAFATFVAGAPVGDAFGNIFGAVFTQLTTESWHSSFYLIAGMSALCAIGATLSFDPDVTSTQVDRRVDWIGAGLVTTGLVLIFFVLSQGPIAPNGWKSPYIITLLILGVLLVGGFLAWEHYLENVMDNPNSLKSAWTPPPLMRLSIWSRANGRMAAIIVIAFLNWSGFMGWSFWVQLYYQNYLHLSPIHTMLRVIPMVFAGTFSTFVVALLVTRLPLVAFVVTAALSTASAGILFALIDPSATYWAFGFPSTVLTVFGADLLFSSGTIFVAKIATGNEQSVAGALFQITRQLGTAFGLTISTIVFNSVVSKESRAYGVIPNIDGSNAPLAAQLKGYRSAQWTIAAFSLLAALIAALFLRGVGIVGDRDQTKKDEIERKNRQ